MENLNAEQIKKALECCTRGRKSNEDIPCLECPYNECNIVGGTSERQIKGTCQGWLMKDALALIKSQEQRIKELTDENAKLARSCTELEQKCASLTSESVEKCASVKADTVRKMRERFNSVAYQSRDWSHGEHPMVVELDDIDQIANELLEGSDET